MGLVGGGDRLQVVNVVEEDALNAVHLRIDIARNRDIDEKHGPVAAAVNELSAVLGAEDRLRRSRGSDDDVGAVGTRVEVLIANDMSAKLRRQAHRARLGAVRDVDGTRSALNEVPGGELAHLAGPDEKNLLAIECAEDFLGQV